MTVTPQAARPYGLWPALRKRPRLIIGSISALLLIGAFLMWGPIGLGNGPLAVQIGGTVASVEHGQGPVGFILPMYNSGHGLAVIDAVALVGGTRYAGPRVLGLEVVASAACGGAWPAKTDGGAFVMIGCGGRAEGALIGRGVGFSHGSSPGFPAAAEVAAPRPGTCWVITNIIVHYHVGIRHYTATDPFPLAVCGKDAAAQVTPALNAAEFSG
jgi:hypothetical protein